ncbi:MAG: hypothetical protein OXI25_05375 [Chloroflexota bacterium]|nr:hypothetical protein [Chloroflexota bacterium]
MSQQSTLLSFVAQRHVWGIEDAATSALSFILSHSASARQSLSEFLGDEDGPLPIAKAQTWMADAYGAIPDLACLDEDGNTVALVESKFWAPLTANQPVTYWRRLPARKRAVLLFLAPAYRVDGDGLWDELEARLREAGHQLGQADKSDELIIAQSETDQRRLMLTSWELLLDRMASRAAQNDDTQAGFQIAELQGLAVSAIESDRPLRDENLKRLIADSVKRLEELKWANASELTVGQSPNSYWGRYFRLSDAAAWLGIDYDAAKQMQEKALHLTFGGYGIGDVSVKLEEVRSRLTGTAEHRSFWGNDAISLSIDLPSGNDYENTLNHIVAQLEGIAKLVDPEGPTYQRES